MTAMLDRTIPFYNTILKCSSYHSQPVELPTGFSIVPYSPGCEKAWARLEYAIGDFSSLNEAEEYFVKNYLGCGKPSPDNIRFLLNNSGTVIGTCTAWQDDRNGVPVSSLHWLVVDESYQGMGLGRALCRDVMNIYCKQSSLPVYIHTQPWSFKAIFLYLSLGFKLQKTDTFSHYTNEYDMALSTLKSILPLQQLSLLLTSSED